MFSFKAAALFLTGVVLLLPGMAHSQELLTLEEAVRIGLQNNYDIRIADRQESIAENNVTLGNAGFLPTVQGRLNRDFANNDTRNQFNSMEPRIVNNSKSNTLNTGAFLNWTVFDGGQMFINYDRLKALEASGDLLTKSTVETTMADIITAYYEVVRQAQKIEALKEAIAISQERIDVTQAQYEVGVSAKVEILRAQVDFNADRSELLLQEELLQNAKITLNQLLARDPVEDFRVVDTIIVDQDVFIETVAPDLVAANPTLKRFQVERELALLDLRAARALRYPSVSVNGGYGLVRNIQEPAFFGEIVGTSENRRLGFSYGLGISLPLFNGFEVNRLTQNAKLQLETSTIAYQQTQNRLLSELSRAYSQYTNRLKLLSLEESNVKLAQENAAIALERYKLGLLTAIELREAQRNELVAANRLIDIKYQAKAAEVELKRLSSTLVSEGPVPAE
ncbi:outer membrane protein TolC [Pontibacter ummariensis]|uniref:Outer membrane protein TolC n=1 Tax=Pontibacter ummariensis TaxID=1610492 RepID=A0A239BFT2_9BACT|nr:TolC family protein [Pontibacter ummariensis]PRY16481.1 outer membrane protein TolC [Pontibacter ummariensis]SNS05933.1 Outer membrane protein TolC [Pontibacter ummariensis]